MSSVAGAIETAEAVRGDGVACLGGYEYPVIADDAPCDVGFVVVKAHGCKWSFGPSSQAKYNAARKRMGVRCINLGRPVRQLPI